MLEPLEIQCEIRSLLKPDIEEYVAKHMGWALPLSDGQKELVHEMRLEATKKMLDMMAAGRWGKMPTKIEGSKLVITDRELEVTTYDTDQGVIIESVGGFCRCGAAVNIVGKGASECGHVRSDGVILVQKSVGHD